MYSNLKINKNIQKLVDGVYERANAAIGECWMRFKEIFNILLENVDTCDAGNLDQYLSCICTMLSWKLAYKNHNYGKWLSDYWVMINPLQYDKKNSVNEQFAQPMTCLPYSYQPMDLWIEITIKLYSKLKQGWLKLWQNDTQLFCITREQRGKNKDSFKLPSLSSKTCGMPANKNETGWTGCTKFNFLHGWFQHCSIWWKCNWASLGLVWCYCIA